MDNNNRNFLQMESGEIWTDLAFAIVDADIKQRLDPFPGQRPYDNLLDCCRAMRMLKDRGMKAMYYFQGLQRFEVAKINFCPECGRPL